MTLVRLCKLPILLLVLPFNAKLAQATEPYELTFAVNTPGSFPYLYYDDPSQTYKGLVPEFFAALKRRELLDITFVDSNQQRSETFAKEGKLICILRIWAGYLSLAKSLPAYRLFSIRPFYIASRRLMTILTSLALRISGFVLS